MKKYQATGFTRFFIFLLFFAPIAFLGASYYNGEDGIQKIKDIFSSNQTEKVIEEKTDVKKLEKENEDLRKRVEELEKSQ